MFYLVWSITMSSWFFSFFFLQTSMPKTILIPIPISKSSAPRFRNSVEGLNQEIERIIIRDTPEKEETLVVSFQLNIQGSFIWVSVGPRPTTGPGIRTSALLLSSYLSVCVCVCSHRMFQMATARLHPSLRDAAVAPAALTRRRHQVAA